MRFSNRDNYDEMEYNSKEEAHLLEKFNDYVNLEQKISKREFLEISDDSKPGKFGKRFIISSMIQGAILTGLTIALFLNQILVFNGNVETMFEFAFTDNLGIFFFGYILQIGLTAGLAITGLFYNHIEANLERKFTRVSTLLSWLHLFGTNLFGNVITISLIFAGIATSALYQSQYAFLIKLIPPLVYLSTICLAVVLAVGIIGTLYTSIRKQTND